MSKSGDNHFLKIFYFFIHGATNEIIVTTNTITNKILTFSLIKTFFIKSLVPNSQRSGKAI